MMKEKPSYVSMLSVLMIDRKRTGNIAENIIVGISILERLRAEGKYQKERSQCGGEINSCYQPK